MLKFIVARLVCSILLRLTNREDAAELTALSKLMYLEKLSSSVLYRDILPGADLEYVTLGGSIKENVIIKEKGDSYSYSFELKLNGLTASLESDGSVSLVNESTGETDYVIPAPVLFDSAAAYGSASYTLTEQNGNGKYTLTVTADTEWMNSADRVFPVTLDPAVSTASNRSADLYVDSSKPSSSFGSSEVLKVGPTTTAYCGILSVMISVRC